MPSFMPNRDMIIKIFVYGLDNVGKSSYIRYIKTGKYDNNFFPPTKQFKIVDLENQGVHLSFWDMAGQKMFRKNWAMNSQASNIVVYLFDVADTQRYDEAKDAFYSIMNLYDTKNLPLLFLVNKIDLKPEISKEELIKYFELDKIKDRKWDLHLLSVEKNLGVNTSINWIMEQVEEIEESDLK
jgi:small GTP-binding protein